MGCRTPQLPLSASFQLDSINTGVAENGRVGGREQALALAAASPGLRAPSLTDPPTRVQLLLAETMPSGHTASRLIFPT